MAAGYQPRGVIGYMKRARREKRVLFSPSHLSSGVTPCCVVPLLTDGGNDTRNEGLVDR